jgi:transcription elongation factor Elf1
MPIDHDNTARQGYSGFRAMGSGLTTTFLCAACSKPKLTTGRRLKRVQGLRTWVCKACAEKP